MRERVEKVDVFGWNKSKELVLMETKILVFIPDSTYQPSNFWRFIYHMCAYLVDITVVQCNAQPSSDKKYFKVF